MSHSTFPLTTRALAVTPPVGSFTVFRDKENAGLLTTKNSDCVFTVIEGTVHDEAADLQCICDRTEEIIEAAACALKKGLMTPVEYDNIVNNISLTLTHNVDPLTGSHQIIIQNQPAIFVSSVITPVLCNGDSTGTYTPTAVGGVPPFIATVYSGGADPANLAAGSYTATFEDAAGNQKVVGFIITEPAALAGALSSTPETGAGNDGTATVLVTGGTPGFTYLWDDGGAQTTPTAVGLAAGPYNVTVTDANGCVAVFGPIVVA